MAEYFNSNSESFGNGNRGNIEYSYYSRYSFLNNNQNISLRFEFRSGLMQIKLYTKVGDSWNSDPAEIVYLSPMKAYMLNEQIQKFRDYMNNTEKIDEKKAFGVNGGMGEKIAFIAFHTNKDKEVLITIGKFDGNGTIVEELTYTCQKNYNYALDWKNLAKMDLEKAYYNYAELDIIQKMVQDFSRSTSGAFGYGIHDTGRYDLARILNKLDPIYDKLGIERLSNPRYNNNRGTNNFLNSIGNSSENKVKDNHSEHGSIDDLLGI